MLDPFGLVKVSFDTPGPVDEGIGGIRGITYIGAAEPFNFFLDLGVDEGGRGCGLGGERGGVCVCGL